MHNDLPIDDPAVLRALSAVPTQGVALGELAAVNSAGNDALVICRGEPHARALKARTAIDLRGCHIGREVLLVFESGDPNLPIVIGVLRGADASSLFDPSGQVELDADGDRMVVSARERLVLRCGAASITLTRAGKVLIEGTYLLSRSSGVHRIQGGSVHLN